MHNIKTIYNIMELKVKYKYLIVIHSIVFKSICLYHRIIKEFKDTEK